MADEARLNELLDLVEQARAEGDSATEQKAIAAYKRESAPQAAAQPFPDTYGGTGGFSPMLARIGGAAQGVGGRIGMTPGNTANPVANAMAPGEAALQFGTAGAAMPIAGLAGIGQGAWNMLAPNSMRGPDAADRVRQVQQAMTYQPRTGAGAGMNAVANTPMELYGAGTNYLGEKAAEITGSPMIGAGIKTAGDIAPAFLGAGKSGMLERSPARGGKYKPGSDVPATDALKAAKNDLYKASEDAGVVIKPASTAKAADVLKRVADEENVGNMPATIKAAYDTLKRRAENNEPLTLRDADNVRQQISDAFKSKEAADVRLAGKFRDAYDRYLNGLGADDIKAGDAAQGLEMLKQARAMNQRFAKSQMIDEIQNRADIDGQAKYTQAGTEHALRTEFKRLAKDKDEMRKYTPEEQAAIRKVAAPGFAQNLMRGIGKFDPFKGPVAAGASLGTSGLLAGFLSPLAAGLPVAGMAASRIANAMTRGNVSAAREALVGRGMSPPLETLKVRSSAPQPMTGELMPREPLALPAPNIISGPRSAPGTAYAREQMGLTPDVELAGMQHPGMARQSVPPPAPQPKALPYLPDQPSPIIVDAAGRAATDPATLANYLREMGLDNVRAKGKAPKPRRGLFDPIEEPTRASARPAVGERSSTQLKLELQRLLVHLRSVPAGADALYVQGLKRHMAELQAELGRAESRESSGGASAQRPAK